MAAAVQKGGIWQRVGLLHRESHTPGKKLRRNFRCTQDPLANQRCQIWHLGVPAACLLGTHVSLLSQWDFEFALWKSHVLGAYLDRILRAAIAFSEHACTWQRNVQGYIRHGEGDLQPCSSWLRQRPEGTSGVVSNPKKGEWKWWVHTLKRKPRSK